MKKRQVYARRDMRSECGVLKSFSYGKMVIKWWILPKTYRSLTEDEKKKYTLVTINDYTNEIIY